MIEQLKIEVMLQVTASMLEKTCKQDNTQHETHSWTEVYLAISQQWKHLLLLLCSKCCVNPTSFFLTTDTHLGKMLLWWTAICRQLKIKVNLVFNHSNVCKLFSSINLYENMVQCIINVDLYEYAFHVNIADMSWINSFLFENMEIHIL